MGSFSTRCRYWGPSLSGCCAERKTHVSHHGAVRVVALMSSLSGIRIELLLLLLAREGRERQHSARSRRDRRAP